MAKKMLLVSGMPRSGRAVVFKNLMSNSKVFARIGGPHPWNPDESQAIDIAMRSGINGKSAKVLFDTLKNVWSDDAGKRIIAYKSSHMVFFPNEIMNSFSTVILCAQSVDEFMSKVGDNRGGFQILVNHVNDIAWLKKYAKRINKAKDPIRELGIIWNEATINTYKKLSKKRGVSVHWVEGEQDITSLITDNLKIR